MALRFYLRRKFRRAIRKKGIPPVGEPLPNSIGGKIYDSEMKIAVFCSYNGVLLKGLFLENQARAGESYYLLPRWTDSPQRNDYVRGGNLAIRAFNCCQFRKNNQLTRI